MCSWRVQCYQDTQTLCLAHTIMEWEDLAPFCGRLAPCKRIFASDFSQYVDISRMYGSSDITSHHPSSDEGHI